MDNLCHTLAGAAFAQAGLGRRTRLAGATLVIGANLPDVDVLVFATSAPAVAFRRGWTHGIAAQALLPVALTALMLLVARTIPADDDGPPARAGWLLALSYLGVLSHVGLDLLNNYGIRLLAPFDWRWFYGDAVFILDPWLWLTLGAGLWLSARRAADGLPPSTTPARLALVAAALYIAAMSVSAQWARSAVLDAWRDARRTEPLSLMVGPRPVTPFHRTVVVDAGDHYETGTFTWAPWRPVPGRPTAPYVSFDAVVPKNDRDPRVARAREVPHIRGFLAWSRFPFWDLEEAPAGTRVRVGDMRFRGRGAFTQDVVVPEAADIISAF
ncbi:MAG: metal-dependent hydrolase [Acidobacteria bacterium]|nr:metal-dependent hydrolase [Acidobacteriota bacterium]